MAHVYIVIAPTIPDKKLSLEIRAIKHDFPSSAALVYKMGLFKCFRFPEI